jgi:hypothetical protein
MKKIILASVAIVLLGLTGFAAFGKNDVCLEKGERKTNENPGLYCELLGSRLNVDANCGDDTSKCKENCKTKCDAKAGVQTSDTSKQVSEPKPIPASRMYFMVPMADSMPVDTTKGC